MLVHGPASRVRAGLRSLLLGRGVIGRLLRLALLLILALGTGAWLRGKWFFGRLLDDMATWPALAQRRLDGLLAHADRVVLDLHHKDWQVLVQQRERALAEQVFRGDEAQMVPATLHLGDKKYDVKVRLKGDLVDQFEGDKWSFRVRVEGDKACLGMKQFSLHSPAARNGLTEWLWHQTMQREDLLGLRYTFVTLTINGKDLGVYAVEEHFEKRLIEHQRRREGPILRFDESAFWSEHVAQIWPLPQSQTSGAGSLPAAPIDTFQASRTLAEGGQRVEFMTAVGLLERLRRGELPASAVLDHERVARYWALADLFGAEHGARWHNVRFYWNPVTARLEPIAFDGNAGQLTRTLIGTSEGAFAGSDEAPPPTAWYARLAADPLLFAAYTRALARVSAPEYLDQLLHDLGDELTNHLRVLRSEVPSTELPTATLRRNQAYIRSMLAPPQLLHAYPLPAAPGGPTLELGAVQALPVEVLGIECQGTTLAAFTPPLWLPGFGAGQLPRYRPLTVALPAAAAAPAPPPVLVRCRIAGTSSERTVPIAGWPRVREAAAIAPWRQLAGNLDGFPFLVLDAASRSVLVKPGTWRVDHDLVLPAGLTLRCREGTTLDLVQSALILCRGPVDLTGSAEQPVVIRSSDQTGQGLIVLAEGARSQCSWLHCLGLRFPKREGLGLTSSVTFYEAPVTFTSCTFADNKSEDALNVVRSDVALIDCTFRNTSNDAFDCDFCSIVVRGTTFDHPGNDAIDVSGSTMTVEAVTIVGAGDKGVSVGENSQGTVRSVTIRDSQIAVGSKDLSTLEVQSYDIRNCRVGFAAYQKKPEFGPSHMQIHEFGVLQVERPFLIEEGSQVLRGSNAMPVTGKNVASLLYGAVYGKASR